MSCGHLRCGLNDNGADIHGFKIWRLLPSFEPCREEELNALSGSLTLLTNICLAWTAMKMQTAIPPGFLNRDNIDYAWLQSVSPAHFNQINMRGTFSFPLEKYYERLFGESPALVGVNK